MRKLWLITAGTLLLGHFLPWAQHNTAALTLGGHDLAIFLNDTPYAGGFANEWFYVPAWVAGALIAFAAHRSGLPRWQKLALGALGAGIALLGLPPYEKLRDISRQPDYVLRLVVSVVVMLDCLMMAVLRPILPPAYALALTALNLIPLYGFSLMRWSISQLYGNEVTFGSGWWLTMLAVGLGVGGYAYGVLNRLKKKSPHSSNF